MVDFIRKLVSGERRRFEDEANNVNLDLSYITSRIIAMSYPSDGLEGYYRNPIEKVRIMQINLGVRISKLKAWREILDSQCF